MNTTGGSRSLLAPNGSCQDVWILWYAQVRQREAGREEPHRPHLWREEEASQLVVAVTDRHRSGQAQAARTDLVQR